MKLAGFERLSEIGSGAFGTVYRAWQVDFQREVAIKVLHDTRASEEDLGRFERERRVLGGLSSHPHIVTVHAAGTTETGHRYIVMAFLDRGDWAGRITSSTRLDVPEVLDVGVKLCGALATAHDAGIVHRDIKPDNILLDEFGEPQLADFGIARTQQTRQLTVQGGLLGTVAYMAPEAFDGAVTPSTDLWSLAATLHHALLGSPAYRRAEMIQTMYAILNDELPSLVEMGVPPVVEEAVAAGLARSPADRPADAAAFGRVLQQAQATLGLSPTRLLQRGVQPGPLPTAQAVGPSPPTRVAGEATDGPPITSGPATVPVPGLARLEEARVRWLTGDVPSAEQLLAELAGDDNGMVADRARVGLAEIEAARGDVGAAIGHLRPLINEHGPAREHAAITLSRLLAAMGDPDGAMTSLARASAWPGEARGDLLAEYADLLQRMGEEDDARDVIRTAADLPDGQGQGALLLGAALDLATGNRARAEAVSTRLEFEAKDTETAGLALIVQGNCAERVDPDRAIACYRRVVDGDFPPEPVAIALLELQALHRDLGDAEEATAMARRLVDGGHPVAGPLAGVLEAAELAGRGDLSAAEGWLRTAEDRGRHPSNRPVLAYGRAALAAARDDRAGVEAALEPLFAAYATEHGAALQVVAAQLLADAGDPVKARALLERALDRGGPEHRAERLLVLGLLAEADGDDERADRLLRDALAVGHPTASRHAQVALGRRALIRGDVDTAEAHLRRVIASGDWALAPEASVGLAEAMLMKGRWSRARALLETASDARSVHVSARAMAVLADELGHRGERAPAEELLTRAAARAESDTDAFVLVMRTRAALHRLVGEHDSARQAYLRAAERATLGDREELLLEAALTYVDEDDDVMAVTALGQLVESVDDPVVLDHATLFHAHARLRLGEQDARRTIRHVADGGGAAAVKALVGLAELYEDEGRPEEARHLYERWRDQAPADPEPLRRIAQVLLGAGRASEAMDAAKTALDIGGPEQMEPTLLVMGDVHRALGDHEAAAACWRRVLKSVDPDLAEHADERLRSLRQG